MSFTHLIIGENVSTGLDRVFAILQLVARHLCLNINKARFLGSHELLLPYNQKSGRCSIEISEQKQKDMRPVQDCGMLAQHIL